MSNLQTTSLGSVPQVNRVESIVGILNRVDGVTASFNEDKRAIVAVFSNDMLLSLSEEGQPKMDMMRSLLYPFQEMLKMVESKEIAGFVFSPDAEHIHDAASLTCVNILGRTLNSLCKGEISLR